MEEIFILLNQVISDLVSLKDDAENGLYKENAEGFKKEWDRICEKQTSLFKITKEKSGILESKMAQILRLMELLVDIYKNSCYSFPKEEIQSPKDKPNFYEEGNCQDCGKPLNNAEGKLCEECKIVKAND